jgi:hypothetical protein
MESTVGLCLRGRDLFPARAESGKMQNMSQAGPGSLNRCSRARFCSKRQGREPQNDKLSIVE